MGSKMRVLGGVVGAALLTGGVNLSAVTWAGERAAPPAPISPSKAATVLGKLTVPGTSWSRDPGTGKVTVTYDDTVHGATLTRLRAMTAPLGAAVALVYEPGVLTRRSGGTGIHAEDGTRCSLGFSVLRGKSKKPYFITAGHCGTKGLAWLTSEGKPVGTVVASVFPGADYALGEYAPNAERANVVQLGKGKVQDISHAEVASVGRQVTRKGDETGVRRGKVISLNVTVNYPEGQVKGLIKTDVCADHGDSGGPLFSGTAALGLLSGGKGNCTTGGVSYYQPISAALTAYGVTLY